MFTLAVLDGMITAPTPNSAKKPQRPPLST
jgi:hypothetical protein